MKLTVDDGSGTTKAYSLDFNAASGMGRQPGTEEPQPEEGVEQVPARSDGKCVIQDGDLTITAERPLFSPDSIAITVDDGTGSPTTYTLDFPEETEEAPTAEEPQTDQAAAAQVQPATGQAAPEAEPVAAPSAAETATPAGTAEPRGAAEPAAAQAETPQPATAPGADATPNPEASAAVTADTPKAEATPPGHTTSPQSWLGDQKGSLSGVLESNDEVGEAGLASVPDAPAPESAEATGMAGAGLPMMGGPNGATSDGPGRAGSGWSVHGDLFDSAEPVYSMHGVLGDDDLEPRETQ